MKAYKTEEILEFAKEIWGRTEPNIEITENTPKQVRIKVSAMYESPGLSFAMLKKISEFFETDHINDDDRFSNGGCETCDYGSSYGFELRIYEG